MTFLPASTCFSVGSFSLQSPSTIDLSFTKDFGRIDNGSAWDEVLRDLKGRVDLLRSRSVYIWSQKLIGKRKKDYGKR